MMIGFISVPEPHNCNYLYMFCGTWIFKPFVVIRQCLNHSTSHNILSSWFLYGPVIGPTIDPTCMDHGWLATTIFHIWGMLNFCHVLMIGHSDRLPLKGHPILWRVFFVLSVPVWGARHQFTKAFSVTLIQIQLKICFTVIPFLTCYRYKILLCCRAC